MRYFKILIAVILLVGCEEYFRPDIDASEPVYVFEGLITDQPEPYKVRIMKTFGYSSKTEFVTDARVNVKCNDGRAHVLKLDSTGYYTSDPTKFVGEVGKSYQLDVYTMDNKHFESTIEELLPCPDIENLNGLYFETKKIKTNGDIYYDEVEYGICATNTTATAGYTPYYRYECKMILQTQQRYTATGMTADRYIYRPLLSTGSLFIADANNYTNKKITNNQLYKTSTKTILAGIDSLIEGMTNFTICNYGEFILVKQFSMNEKQYKFWKAVKDQQESSKYLFGQIENRPIGNITCKTGEKAFGYFGVSAVKQDFCALSLKHTNNTVKKYDIKYFPDTDTIVVYDSPQPFTKFFEN